MDFTVTQYKLLMLSLMKRGYGFLPFKEYLLSPDHSSHGFRRDDQQLEPARSEGGASGSEACPKDDGAYVILRHDVDRLPQNSLRLAKLEYSLGIKGTYYFRIVPQSYDLHIMNEIEMLDHEIGYHYEDVHLVIQNSESKTHDTTPERLIDLAYESFCKNLRRLQENFDIKTVCMHGSPRSKYDNKIIWQKYSYKSLGILGEPYLDVDFNEFAYFTDTGRRWNGDKVSLRDKVNSKFNFNLRTTKQVINHAEDLPQKVMLTIHPQRWNDKFVPWMKELGWQSLKNVGKRLLVMRG